MKPQVISIPGSVARATQRFTSLSPSRWPLGALELPLQQSPFGGILRQLQRT